MDLEPIIRDLRTRLYDNRGENVKLGVAYSFSLPPIITCPGHTELCSRVCYSRWMYAYRASVKKNWDRNYMVSRLPQFEKIITEVLHRLQPGVLRLHVSGDFFGVPYARAWLHAINANPHIKPVCFTKVWRVPRFQSAIDKLGWPTWLYASKDAETGEPPEGVRVATMSEVTKYSVKMKRAKAPRGTCPQQTAPLGAVTCASCRRCPLGRADVTFLKH